MIDCDTSSPITIIFNIVITLCCYTSSTFSARSPKTCDPPKHATPLTPFPSGLPSSSQGFAASVGVGLIKFPGAAGAHQLAVSLEGKYASGQRDGSAQQLAVLFSLLPPEIQPVSLVKSLLAYPTVNTSVLNGVKAEVLDLPSILGESPSVLLPAEVRPRYDEVVKAFFIPGVSQQFKENGMELAFGARGPFPISKVGKRVGAKALWEVLVS